MFDREVSDENEGKTDIIGLRDSEGRSRYGIEFVDQHVGFSTTLLQNIIIGPANSL